MKEEYIEVFKKYVKEGMEITCCVMGFEDSFYGFVGKMSDSYFEIEGNIISGSSTIQMSWFVDYKDIWLHSLEEYVREQEEKNQKVIAEINEILEVEKWR